LPPACLKTTVLLLIFSAFVRPAAAESNWPTWRGPHGNGHSTQTGFPVEWSADSVVWKTPTKGLGQSSPVVWGERIFLTAALENGRQRLVFAVNRNDGKILWEQVAWTGAPEPSHKMNGWASATCATDGERVYAFFGRGGGLHCYSVEGEHLWSTGLGEFASPWGTAACPLIVGDLVIQNCDSEKEAALVALDKKTGAIAWKTKRDDFRGWSSPILIRAGDRAELVLNGHSGVRAYHPADGKELWFCKSFNGRGEPTATPAGGLLILVNGLKGDMYAVRPGGNGDVTKSSMMWHTPRASGRDLPSPIAIDNQLLVMSMQGILTGYDTGGKELWTGRVGGNFSASPVAFQGLAVFLSEDGTAVVVKPADRLDIVARNTVGAAANEIFRASITPSAGQLFIRSDRVLYAVGSRKSADQ
jgi:outer membrane protein assembly factor BamB